MHSNFIPLKVHEVIQETEDSVRILLKDEENRISSFSPGQFITVTIPTGISEVKRSYSIFTTPDQLPILGIAVKKIPGGLISPIMDSLIKKDAVLLALPPAGRFTFDQLKGNDKHLYFYGAGSGITPLHSMIRSALLNQPGVKITLLYSNRNESSVVLGTLLEELRNQYSDRFRIVYFFSRAESPTIGRAGRIDASALNEILAESENGTIQTADHFLCGPSGLMNEIGKTLIERGVNKNLIHREYYGLTVSQDYLQSNAAADHEVTIIIENTYYRVMVNAGESILEAALRSGLDLPFSCMSGSCASCRAKLLAGQVTLVDQSTLSDEEIKAGFCLTCVGYPLSDDVIIDYDDYEL